MTQETGTSSSQPSGLEIAMQWAELPAEHLQMALAALEPQLKRDHELRMNQEQRDHELRMEQERSMRELRLEQARLAAEEATARRAHALYLTGLIAGFVLSIGMLTGAVIVGTNDQPWLAAMLSGPSLLALATLFVLRRNDSATSRSVAQAQRSALNAAQSAPPAPTPTNPGTAGGI
ncbi:hypothetical protein [Streptomyces gossypiisoli]|uniref:hypothetical protein n=1 Tax=Streptomyces gossypiisoli TaxID=2748864 RepID=UPI0015DB831F|nr:hypothetical protein [Streptomyces gossypiisoli]